MKVDILCQWKMILLYHVIVNGFHIMMLLVYFKQNGTQRMTALSIYYDKKI